MRAIRTPARVPSFATVLGMSDMMIGSLWITFCKPSHPAGSSCKHFSHKQIPSNKACRVACMRRYEHVEDHLRDPYLERGHLLPIPAFAKSDCQLS